MVQIKTICRRQNECERKIEIWFGKGRKHCGRRRKCWLPALHVILVFSQFSIFKNFGILQLLHCITYDCAQNDRCCRRAVKLYSFIHSGYQHSLLFPRVFKRLLYMGVVKGGDCVVKSQCF